MSDSPLDDDPVWRGDIEQAVSAVLYGVVGSGPSSYSGVSKDEALEYAADLARLAQRVLRVIDHDYPYVGLSCFTADQHAAGIVSATATRNAIRSDLGVVAESRLANRETAQ